MSKPEDTRLVSVAWLVELKRVLESAAVQTPTYKMGVEKVWAETLEKIKPCDHDMLGHHCQKCGQCGVTILMERENRSR